MYVIGNSTDPEHIISWLLEHPDLRLPDPAEVEKEEQQEEPPPLPAKVVAEPESEEDESSLEIVGLAGTSWPT